MQLVWKTCLQWSFFTWTPVRSTSRQIEQLTSFSYRLISLRLRSVKLSKALLFWAAEAAEVVLFLYF